MGNPMQPTPVCRRGRTLTTDSDSDSRPRRRLRQNRTHHNGDLPESRAEFLDQYISDTEEEDDNADYESVTEFPRRTERTSGHFVDIETPDESNGPSSPELDLQRIRRRRFGFRERIPLSAADDGTIDSGNSGRSAPTYSLSSNSSRHRPFNEAEGDLAMLVAHLRQQVLLNRITNAEPAPGTSPPNYIPSIPSLQAAVSQLEQLQQRDESPSPLSSQGRDSVTRPVPALTWRPPIVNRNTHADMTVLSRLRNHFSQSPSSTQTRGLPSPSQSTDTSQGGLQSASGSLTFPSMIPRAQNPRPVSRSLRLHVGESGYATVSLADDFSPYSAQRRGENGHAL